MADFGAITPVGAFGSYGGGVGSFGKSPGNTVVNYANQVTNIVFSTQPSTVHSITGVRGIARDAATTTVITARDASNNTVTGLNVGGPTLTLLVDPQTSGAAATLGGTLTPLWVNGVATITNLTIDKENTTTVQVRATYNSLTADSTAFCVYHPVCATAPYTDTDRKYGALLINTVGPNGLRTCVANGSLVGSFNDPMSTTISWAQTTDSLEVTMPAWNAAPTFDTDDLYDGDAEAVAAANWAGDDVYFNAVCDIVQNTSATPSFVHEILGNGHWFAFMLVTNENWSSNDGRNGAANYGHINHGVAEGTPSYLATLHDRATATTQRVGAATATGPDTSPDATKSVVITANTIAGRVGVTTLNLGEDGSAPNLWLFNVYGASKESSATAWRSALGTALGLSL